MLLGRPETRVHGSWQIVSSMLPVISINYDISDTFDSSF